MKSRTPIRSKVVEPRICSVCEFPYTPRWEEQQTCGGRCARVCGGRKNKGHWPPAFAAAARRRREAKRQAIRATCRQRWPEMTVREVEIFEFAMRTGYDRGYAMGLKSQRRQKASAAA